MPAGFSARERFEEIVLAACEELPGGPWAARICLSTLDPSRVSVEVRGPRRALLTSFPPDASRAEIVERLRMFSA